MPRLDGTALTRRIRERRGDGYTYVIVLTGEADEQAAREAMQAGADDLLVKPLDRAALERQLISARRVIGMHDRLRADARMDALTGIANRRAMDEDLPVLCQRAARSGHDLAVALFDLDRFKAYNDAAGHPAGDALLRTVAQTLRGALRGSDILYRYGGEEFLALLPAQDALSARIAAERLRAGIARMAMADAALYAAKQSGRDCVRTAAVARAVSLAV